MTENEKKMNKELENIYRYAKANYGGSPKTDNPLYKKYNDIRMVIAELSKTNYLESTILRMRYFEAKSYETISIELSYSPQHIYRLRRSGIRLFTNKVLEISRERKK
ncbi:MAG: hypothetical protein RBS24_00080 [Bacilli bacterium]|nr:hypothetical protein [Bacilli bacterium]